MNPSLSQVLAERLAADTALSEDGAYRLHARYISAHDVKLLEGLHQQLSHIREGTARDHDDEDVSSNADSGDSLALLARSWGHEVAVARDGPSALNLAEKFRPERALAAIDLAAPPAR